MAKTTIREAQAGVPTAGTTGQVLTKNSNTNYDYSWAPGGGGGGGGNIGDSVIGGTTGSVLFVGAGPVLAQDNANFFWDNTNNRLGLGTTVPSQQLELTGSIELPITTSSTIGVIYSGANRFIHGFGSTSNTFIGRSSGNFTNTGSNNSTSGFATLSNLSSGNSNTSLGAVSGNSVTTGSQNTLVGQGAGQQISTGSENVAIGQSALAIASGPATRNTAVGTQALALNTTGSNNIALGWHAADTGITGSDNIIIGNQIQPQSPASNQELRIADVIYGTNISTAFSERIGIRQPDPNSTLEVLGSVSFFPSSVIPTGTLGNAFFYVATTGGVINLPEQGLGSLVNGRIYYIRAQGNPVTLTAFAGDQIRNSGVLAGTLNIPIDSIACVMATGNNQWTVLNIYP